MEALVVDGWTDRENVIYFLGLLTGGCLGVVFVLLLTK